ncbi:hypothetical protein [Bacillus wiedmannii]|uniref:DUF2971 domain-containing protein n=1 Tax=Bacillus wiedmannii TaxID=1890302 RepID=A0A1C4ESN5_9BACI|nr:hypothetical protein [Bacillus wiedmannii]SCC46541.1 Uncharacterized protein BC05F1_03863 [Bacillus wiedmannii]
MSEYLYHYTNLETLKLILENKTFRLSSLSRMDDLEEGETEDFQKLGRFTYISSWTDNPYESLALWSYSKGNDGVRVKMRKDIFKTEYINENSIIDGIGISIEENFNIGLLDLMKNKNVSFVPPRAELIRVTYTNLERLLRPTVFKKCQCGQGIVQTENLGIFKRAGWQEQREWRYRLSSLPFNMIELAHEHNNFDFHLEKLRHREDLGFIDLPLKDDVFDDMEVLCSPLMGEESKLEVKRVLEYYASNASIKCSELRMRV